MLLEIVEPATAGNPMSEKKWLRRMSLSTLETELEQRGYRVSQPTISRLLRKHDYSESQGERIKSQAS